jgi:AmmeMemoRadiSam system protein A
LHKRGELRGCIGVAEARLPLFLAVMEAAMAAALRDPRFAAVRAEEVADLEIEVSVLHAPTLLASPIRPESVEIGRHGLMITQGSARGLLLPQVATGRGWRPERLLGETCRKAGLPADAWRTGARVEIFEAEVFGEPSEATPEGSGAESARR